MDLRLRELERQWKDEGSWESWARWVKALVRAGDPRGEALAAAQRAARGWLVCTMRDRAFHTSPEDRRARQREFALTGHNDARATAGYARREGHLRRRNGESGRRFARAFCRALLHADRLECAIDFTGSVCDWPTLTETEQPFDARAMYEILAHTGWEQHEGGGGGGRRRRLLEDMGAGVRLGATQARTGWTGGGMNDWVEFTPPLLSFAPGEELF